MRFCKALVALAIFSLFAAPFAAHAAPTVSFKAPADGQTVSGSLRQSGACEVAGSSINTSASVGSKTAAPYQCDIDTANFADGSCTLMAVATDKVGATSSTQRPPTIERTSTPVAASDIIARASRANSARAPTHSLQQTRLQTAAGIGPRRRR
ncbi:MAG TPA: Ig-like domain-containing protein [Burkholderiales bacterium]|nr:Ig-like domain-containing protein [Burkholderiales bacterium]HSA70666.1 Ig-like domain-containing protein [Burkholderiales bacterium]